MFSFFIGHFVVDDSCVELNFRDTQKRCYEVEASCPRTNPVSAAASWLFPLMHIVTRHFGLLSGILVDFSAFPPPPPAAPAFRDLGTLGTQIPKLAETVSSKPLNTPRWHVHESFCTMT